MADSNVGESGDGSAWIADSGIGSTTKDSTTGAGRMDASFGGSHCASDAVEDDDTVSEEATEEAEFWRCIACD